MSRARVAWSVAVVDVVAFLLAALVDPSDLSVIPYTVGIILFAGVGALLISKVPANVVGVLLLATGTLIVAAVVVGAYGDVGLSRVPPWPLAAGARTLGDTMFIYPIVVALIVIPLYFPNGRLASPRFRWVVRITIANLVVWTVEATRNVHDSAGTSASGSDLIGTVLDGLELFILAAMLIGFTAAALALAMRFRRGGPIEREQVKWLLAVVALGAAIWPASFLLYDTGIGPVMNVLGFLILFAMPIAVGIAILRYRLYDIDRIISRTIGYGVVSGVLVAVFAGAIIGFQAILSQVTRTNTLAVAGSTLIVAILFQPLRRRVQRVVDRRFNRSRYDAEQTVAAFSARLRDDVDLVSLDADIGQVVQHTLAPASMSLWLRTREVVE